MIKMIDYIINMLDILPDKTKKDIKRGRITRWSVYKVNEKTPVSLSEKDKVIVHSITARSLVLAKHGRPDVQTGVSF